MPDIVRAVHRLPQGAQHRRLQQQRIRAGLDLFQQGRVILGARILATRQRKAEFLEEAVQAFQFLRCRPLVNTVQAGLLVLLKKVRSTDVGRQHAFLNDPVRVVALYRDDVFDLALLVEQHHRFDRFKVDGPTFLTRLQKYLVQRIERLQVRLQGAVRFCFRFRFAGQPGPHLLVGQPCRRAKNRRVEDIILDDTAVVDRHVADHRQPFHIGIQGTQAVGEFFRQHRDHPTRKIDRIAAIHRFAVERRSRLHVMADIGNRHHQPPAAPLLFGEYRVVKIACGFVIDGH